MQTSVVTVERLERAKDGSLGAIAWTLARVQFVHHCHAMVDELTNNT